MKRKLFIGFSMAILLLVFGCVIGVGRMIHRGFSTRDKPTAIEASLATSMRETAILARYKTMKSPAAVTPAVLHDGELYYTIKNGVRLSGMPAFGEPGDDDLASWKLVAFIRHLPSLTPIGNSREL